MTKLNKLTDEQIQNERQNFWNACDEACFLPWQVAIAIGKSLPWLQKKRCEGDGIPFIKASKKTIYYQKSDVLAWLNRFSKVPHTSHPDYQQYKKKL